MSRYSLWEAVNRDGPVIERLIVNLINKIFSWSPTNDKFTYTFIHDSSILLIFMKYMWLNVNKQKVTWIIIYLT